MADPSPSRIRYTAKVSEEHATHAITQTIPEFFFIFNLNDRAISYLSTQFFELTGTDPATRDLTHLVREHIHPEDREAFDTFFTDLAAENNYSGRVELRSNGEFDDIQSLEIYTHPVEVNEAGESEAELVGHVHDISARNERLSLLEKENKKLDHIIKVLAHDLRSPFNKISLITDLLKRSMSEEEQKRHSRYLGMLEVVQGNSMDLLDQLLYLASIQGETKHLHFNIFDARELVDKVAAIFELQLQSKQLSLEVVQPDIQVSISADRLLLEQMLQNLLSNAIKFTPNGGTISISMKLCEPGKMELTVEDIGIGIAPEDIPHLFKEFSRIRRRGVRGEATVGLGLAICKQIIDLHQGEIWAESVEGKGSRFIIRVPC